MSDAPASDAVPRVVPDAGSDAGPAGPLVAVRGVTRRFGDVVALDDVSLDIRHNEFFALLGPSGCGKTTLLRILAGFETPDTGEVLLDGEDLVGVRPWKRPVNLMFQSYALFPHLNVWKNVAYGLERERLGRAEVRERVAEVLETVGLSALAKRRPAQLSGGQRQRVALARAIVKRPRLLLLDEPLAALDRKIRGQMQLELKRLQHDVGITFVVVTHDQEEAMSMADRIAVMNEGLVQQVASPVECYERPASLFVADFIGTTTTFDGLAVEDGVEVEGLGRAVTGPHGLVRGTPAHLCVRPERIVLDPPDSVANRFEGQVIDVQFFGGRSTCAVALPGHEQPVLASVPGSVSLRAGDPVTVGWNAADGVVLES